MSKKKTAATPSAPNPIYSLSWARGALDAAQQRVRDAEADGWAALMAAIQHVHSKTPGGITQKEIAKRAGISPAYMGDICRKHRPVSVSLLKRFEEALSK